VTPEQRIAFLESELTRERARADGLQEIVHALTVKKRTSSAERQARYRERHKAPSVTGGVTVTRNGDASPALPPPLDGSPPLPAPISPSPLSSPPSLFSVASQGESSEAAVSSKRPGKSNALGEFIDWAKAETRKQLAPDAPDNCRMEKHQAARLGEAVKLHGLEACKAAFRLWMGWEGSRSAGYPLGMFAAKWEGWVGRVKAPAAQPAATTPKGSPDDERARALREAVAQARAKKTAGGAQ
jgi:hypothetical protein